MDRTLSLSLDAGELWSSFILLIMEEEIFYLDSSRDLKAHHIVGKEEIRTCYREARILSSLGCREDGESTRRISLDTEVRYRSTILSRNIRKPELSKAGWNVRGLLVKLIHLHMPGWTQTIHLEWIHNSNLSGTSLSNKRHFITKRNSYSFLEICKYFKRVSYYHL